MIPYFEQPSVALGPLTIHAFGVIVAAAAFTGLLVGERRFARVGLDRELGERMAWWIVVAGFVGAHLFSVLLYFPHKVAANPLVLFKVWEDISSFGGMLGGMIGMWLFFRLRASTVPAATRAAYFDVVAFAFPVSLTIGRIACALAHDHPGRVTRFPLAVSLESARARDFIQRVYAEAGRLGELPAPAALPGYGFHDLGLYELLYLALVVLPVLLLIDRRRRSAGAFAVAFVLLYMPVRFALDFLRVADARYAGLTPAQWAALVALAALGGVMMRRRANAAPPASAAPAR